PWQGIYSVDLDARAWCTRPACHAYKLDHARGDDIALRTENPPIDHPSEAVDILFDAKRMHLEEQHWHFEATYFVDAACKYAPFERLPEGPLEYPTKGQE
ncbi:MAG TPA: hypothetical protein VHZ32_17205, partial [Rhizomicrobium sp.]|nr:hypothetical protein [Rhizomicrobium sp.]